MPFEITNIYEQMVISKVLAVSESSGEVVDRNMLEDVVCVALNSLPCRYVRHTVDLAFYMSSGERSEMEDKVASAVMAAFDYIKHSEREIT